MTSALERALTDAVDVFDHEGLRHALVRKWAQRLDRSIGSDEVRGRVQESLRRAKR